MEIIRKFKVNNESSYGSRYRIWKALRRRKKEVDLARETAVWSGSPWRVDE